MRADRQTKNVSYGCACASNYYAVPIMGKSETGYPVGQLKLRSDIAAQLAQVSYEIGTTYSLIPTIRVDGKKATLMSVRIQHNAIG